MGWNLPPDVRARCVSSMAPQSAPTKPARAKRGTGPVSQRKKKTAATMAKIECHPMQSCHPSTYGGCVIVIPIRTVTESNTGDNRSKIGRRKGQRMVTAVALRMATNLLPAFPVRVRFVRVRPTGRKPLDDDNLVSSFKAIRDEVAAHYGVDDGDRRWRWEYPEQEEGTEYAVRVEIEAIGGTA